MALLRTLAVVGIALFGLGSLPVKAQSSLTCSSENGRRNYCAADTRGGVRLARQRSGSACIQGSTWGYDARGVWVDRGCRADFIIRAYRPGPGAGIPPGRPRPPLPGPRPGELVTCSSEDGRRNYCSADTRRGVRLVRQRSGSPCRHGYSWGYDRRGIWVDRGCRADFAVR